jgi:hypothetical protein
MAEPVYDEDKDLDSLNPAELRDREQQYSSPEDEAEDNAIESGSDEESMPNKGAGRNLRQHSESKDAKEQEALNDRVRGAWDNAKKTDKESPEHENQVGRGYIGGKKSDDNASKRWSKKRRNAIIGGAAASGAVGILVFFFGFLNFYKLDGLISNIDEKSFARVNGSLDRRSSKYISAYMKLRLADIGDNPKDIDTDNILFRSNKVDTNSPISDWYKTLRTSSFEEDVFNKHNIKFVSYAYRDGDQIKFRPARIKVKDKIIVGNSLPDDIQAGIRNAVATGDWNSFNDDKLMAWINTDIDIYSNDKEARREIKTVVNDNTHFYQVFQRRHLRKSIQNMTGVRDWRFFENTRNKVDEKKIDIRNKLIKKAIPESTVSGKFVRCLFGITDCRFSEDPSDPQNRAESSLAGDEKPDKEGDPLKNNDPSTPPQVIEKGPTTEVIKKIIANAAPPLEALNIISTLDSISNVDKAMSSGQLSKGVSVARGQQATGLYQVLKTARDQTKSGDLNGAEYNKLMQVLGPIASSEGWQKVVEGDGDPSKLTNTTESQKYCSEENQASIDDNPVKADKQFAYLCANKQIGGSSTAASLENAYNATIRRTIHPIVKAYEPIRNAPVVGEVLGFLNGLFDRASSILVTIMKAPLSLVGLDDNLENAMTTIVNKLTSFLGAGSIFHKKPGAGEITNWLVQGGSYTAEATSRYMGAAATTPASKVAAEQSVIAYKTDQAANMSAFDKYLALSNPDSPAAKTTLAVSQLNLSTVSTKLTDFGSIFRTISSAMITPFNSKASAVKSHTYDAADFAGIVTYDTNPNCYNLEPVTMKPEDVTNAQQVLGADKVPNSDLTWDLVKNGDDWYQYIYDKIGDKDNADKIAETIYNCQLEDNVVKGSLGAKYGYTDDGGLNDSSGASNGAPAEPTNTPGGLPTGDAKQLASQLKPYVTSGKIKCLSSGCPDIINTASGQSIKNSSCYVDALDTKLLGMLLKLAQMDHTFILSAVCTDHPSNPSSLHHQGKAADFNTIDGVFIGPNDAPWDSTKLSAAKKLDQDIVSFMPKGSSATESIGFGQETGRCHPHFDFLDGYNIFDDACHHQHVQVP